MYAHLLRVSGFTAAVFFALNLKVDAQVSRPTMAPPSYRASIATRGVFSPSGNSARKSLFGSASARRANPVRGPYVGRTDAYGRPGLPRGQVYYGGRYFGSFNNRFYGPQYGYF